MHNKMQYKAITEEDLASPDHDRWACAVSKCSSGDPEGCIKAQHCLHGGCFDKPVQQDIESLNREIEQLTKRRDELSVAINQFSALLDNHVAGYQRLYDSMIKQNNQNSAFIYRAVLNDTKDFRKTISRVYDACFKI